MDWDALMGSVLDTCMDVLSVEATYTPGAGDQAGQDVPIRGVFGNAYTEADATRAGVTTTGPWLGVKLDELPIDPEEDDPDITVNGTRYRVNRVERDGQGGARLLLLATTR